MQRGRRRPCTVDDDAALFFLTHVPMGGEREWKPAVEGSQPGPPLQGGPGGDGDRKDHRRPSDSVFAPTDTDCLRLKGSVNYVYLGLREVVGRSNHASALRQWEKGALQQGVDNARLYFSGSKGYPSGVYSMIKYDPKTGRRLPKARRQRLPRAATQPVLWRGLAEAGPAATQPAKTGTGKSFQQHLRVTWCRGPRYVVAPRVGAGAAGTEGDEGDGTSPPSLALPPEARAASRTAAETIYSLDPGTVRGGNGPSNPGSATTGDAAAAESAVEEEGATAPGQDAGETLAQAEGGGEGREEEEEEEESSRFEMRHMRWDIDRQERQRRRWREQSYQRPSRREGPRPESPYDPRFLDDPEIRQSTRRTVMALPSMMQSVLPYVRSDECVASLVPCGPLLREELDAQFRAKHPWAGGTLTLTQLRALKRGMVRVCLDCNAELSSAALAMTLLEKLLLRERGATKTPPPLQAATCLLLAFKANEHAAMDEVAEVLRGTERVLGISTGEVLAHELHVFARLEFGVFLPPREVLPHFRRILKMLRMSDLDYLGTGFYVYEEEKEEYRLAGRGWDADHAGHSADDAGYGFEDEDDYGEDDAEDIGGEEAGESEEEEEEEEEEEKQGGARESELDGTSNDGSGWGRGSNTIPRGAGQGNGRPSGASATPAARGLPSGRMGTAPDPPHSSRLSVSASPEGGSAHGSGRGQEPSPRSGAERSAGERPT